MLLFNDQERQCPGFTMILALFLGSRIGYTLKTYEPREAGFVLLTSIFKAW